MRISFLLGAAGSGKTYRCLSEIRDELLARPEDAPLIFLAPKQSTYQLERQLLEDGGLEGYSRLQIVSFERFASFVFKELRAPQPKFISEQGRTMVLRALLTEMHGELTIFRGAAGRLGFAEELSKQIRELQNHGLSVAEVRRIASRIKDEHSAREKLLDLALVQERYAAWLAKKGLQDGDTLLTAARELLETRGAGGLEFGGIWFDGFAQLTPQELDLLVTALRFTSRATLAFCVDTEAAASSKISAGYLVSQTVGRCRSAIEQRYGKDAVKIESLGRDAARSRFKRRSALAHLEKNWLSPDKFGEESQGAVRLVESADPEAETVFVAREIVQHVKCGGRYREVALLLRDLQNDYPHVLRRVFGRYQIPFFLDHRQSVAHHPLAELTRGALRTLAYNFQHHDWFATLKCGLMRVVAEDLDELENEALARGWNGGVWRTGFSVPNDAILEKRMNRLRERAIQPLAEFASELGPRPRADQLAEAIRALWETLRVEQQLEDWRQESASAALHATVWEQMLRWLEDLALAFGAQQMSLVEWLPIIEAGLQNLTVGVVPPVLDQVLIGTVDRSRNPDLKVLYVLGVNEHVFPASPPRDTLLTEDDRDALRTTGCTLGETPAWRMAGEQFYGYIACTRPRERLVLSYVRSGMDGAQLNPSRFVAQVQRMFPKLAVENVEPARTLEEVVHECELVAVGCIGLGESAALKLPNAEEKLDPGVAHRLYGDELSISVSALERFAACPFKFFVEYGLRVKERKEFLLDVREQGSFQHAVLEIFHRELKQAGLQWRDVTPGDARSRVGRIADELIPTFRDGLMAKSKQNRFTAENYKVGLQELLSVLVEWCATNRFNPEEVEFGFGASSDLPTWRLELGNGRAMLLYGRVDRVDLFRVNKQEALCLVMDYKSGLKAPHRTLLHHGVQQQLPAYLLALTRMKEVAAHFKVEKLSATGCFLLPLRATAERKKSRREALQDTNNSKRARYMHEGLFDVERVHLLDPNAPDETSGQFNYRLTKTGEPWRNSFNALKSRQFSEILERSEELMREFGRRIFDGDIAIRPYKHGTMTPCERCDYQPACRFDPWTQKYNVLRAPEKAEKDEAAD